MVVRIAVDFLVMIHVSTEIKCYFGFLLQTGLPLLTGSVLARTVQKCFTLRTFPILFSTS